MKKLQKILCVVLGLIMLVGMMSACSSRGSSGEKTVIEVAVNQWDAVNLQLKDYYDNYLSKELNLEFIYSDASGDVEAITKFVQNAWAAGAVALMDFATQNLSDVEPVAAKCNELGMYFTTYYQGSEEILAKYDTAVACVASEDVTLADKFAAEVKSLIDDGEAHSMVVLPLAAQYGNIQQTYASIGAVKAFSEVYGFNLSDEDIKERVTKEKNNYIKSDITGREDVKVAIDAKTDAETLSTILKTGEYDVVVISGNLYTRFQQTILEAEQAIGKDIKVVAMTGIEDATQSSFTTMDPFGNPSLNIAVLTPATRAGATLGVMLNAINGDMDAVRVDGKPVMYAYPVWACRSADEYQAMGLIDTAPEYYMFTADEIKLMVKKYTENVDPEYLSSFIAEYGTAESVRERRGF